MGYIGFGEEKRQMERRRDPLEIGVEEKKKQKGKFRILQDKRESINWNMYIILLQPKNKKQYKISALIHKNVLKIVSEL